LGTRAAALDLLTPPRAPPRRVRRRSDKISLEILKAADWDVEARGRRAAGAAVAHAC
jgi:hypothetical protein